MTAEERSLRNGGNGDRPKPDWREQAATYARSIVQAGPEAHHVRTLQLAEAYLRLDTEQKFGVQSD